MWQKSTLSLVLPDGACFVCLYDYNFAAFHPWCCDTCAFVLSIHVWDHCFSPCFASAALHSSQSLTHESLKINTWKKTLDWIVWFRKKISKFLVKCVNMNHFLHKCKIKSCIAVMICVRAAFKGPFLSLLLTSPVPIDLDVWLSDEVVSLVFSSHSCQQQSDSLSWWWQLNDLFFIKHLLLSLSLPDTLPPHFQCLFLSLDWLCSHSFHRLSRSF